MLECLWPGNSVTVNEYCFNEIRINSNSEVRVMSQWKNCEIIYVFSAQPEKLINFWHFCGNIQNKFMLINFLFHHLFCLYAFMQHTNNHATWEIERYHMQIYAVVAHFGSVDVSVVRVVNRNAKEANGDLWQFREVIGALLKNYLR